MFHLFEVLQGVPPEARIQMWAALGDLVLFSFTNKLKFVEQTMVEFITLLTPLIMSIVLSTKIEASVVFNTLVAIHKAKNDPSFSGLLLENTVTALKSSPKMVFGPAWPFLISLCTDVVNSASLSWRTIVKGKIFTVYLTLNLDSPRSIR